MNEKINIVLFFISIMFSVEFYNLCYAKINDCILKHDKKYICIIVITSFLVFINNSYNNLWIKTFLTLGIVLTEFLLIFKDDFNKVFNTYIVVFTLLIGIEIIIINTLGIFNIIENSNLSKYYTYFKLLLSGIIAITEFLFLCIPSFNKFIRKIYKFFYNNIKTINILYLIFFTIALLGMLNVKNFGNQESILIMIFLYLMFLVLFVIIIKLKTQEILLQITNKNLMIYNDKYGKFLDEYKVYKHNIKNKLISLKTYGNKKINLLIDDLLEEETNFSIKNNNLYNIPNGIKGIVVEKLYNVQFNILISNKIIGDPFNNLNPKAFNNISECLGIALDNAIEASKETDNPIIIIDLYENKDTIFLKVGNNFRNAIDLEHLGEKYYSTKNRGSGLGLFSIIRNKIVNEKINIINDFYYIELQIKKNAN